MRRAAFLIVVLIVFAGMAVAVGVRSLLTSGSGDADWGGRSTPVAVYTVGEMEFVDTVEALGTAGANESVSITAKVSDTISRLEFDSGDVVERGQILAELATAEETAGLSEARATLRESEREISRITDLTQRGVAPQQRLDEAQAGLERARARVAAIEARVADRIIRAPFSGVVGLREVSVGELVRPGDVIARLDDSSIIKLDFTVPERFLAVLRTGMPIEARTTAYPGEVFTGEIAQVDSRVDPITRSVTVRALVANADLRLLPGQLMGVEVQRDQQVRPAIPGTSITRMLDTVFVYAIAEGDRGASAVRREVGIGRRSGDYVEVLSGLRPGDRIVAEGVHRVRDGAPVTIADERGMPATVGRPGIVMSAGAGATE